MKNRLFEDPSVSGFPVTAAKDSTKDEIEAAMDEVLSEKETDEDEKEVEAGQIDPAEANAGDIEGYVGNNTSDEMTDELINEEEGDGSAVPQSTSPAPDMAEGDPAETKIPATASKKVKSAEDSAKEMGSAVNEAKPGEVAPYMKDGEPAETKLPATASKKVKSASPAPVTDEVVPAPTPAEAGEEIEDETKAADEKEDDKETSASRKLAHLERTKAALDRKIASMKRAAADEVDLDSEEDDMVESEDMDTDDEKKAADEIEDEKKAADEIVDEPVDEVVAPVAPEDVLEEAELEDKEANARANFAKSVKSGKDVVKARKVLSLEIAQINEQRKIVAKRILASRK